MKYSLKLKLWCVKQMKLGLTHISDISRNRKVPRRTLYRWKERFEENGSEGLVNKNPGREETVINNKFKHLVIHTWYDTKYGSSKMKLFLDEKGFDVSQRQIQKIYKENDLKMNRRKRPEQIKYKTYEWPRPNMLWHTDWSKCPFTNLNIIAFIDDYSRFVVHAEYFSNATTENSLLAFEAAIRKHGIPEAILTDNGTQFTPARTESGPFTKWCEDRGIKHILGRVHHPQTNGKIERWFGTYKQEYDERFNNLNEFLIFYNEVRIHQGIKYKRPIERFIAKL